jgi:hypothetical protein
MNEDSNSGVRVVDALYAAFKQVSPIPHRVSLHGNTRVLSIGPEEGHYVTENRFGVFTTTPTRTTLKVNPAIFGTW